MAAWKCHDWSAQEASCPGCGTPGPREGAGVWGIFWSRKTRARACKSKIQPLPRH